MSLTKRIDDLSSRRDIRSGWFGIITFFFLAFIILPTVYVLIYGITDFQNLSDTVLDDPETMSLIWGAVFTSFSLALLVTIIDLIVGVPMAWIMVRKEFRGKKLLDTLIDMPLAFPTAALGFSIGIFWGLPIDAPVPPGALGIIASPYILIMLLHIIFTYPYMVRSLSAILEQIDQSYEEAGMTLGASRMTAARTITLPLFRAGLITGFILCFARSLSETGGTFIALITIGQADKFFTGPTLIAWFKRSTLAPEEVEAILAVVSIILIVTAIIFLLIIKFVLGRINVPFDKVWPRWERVLSRGMVPKAKDAISFVWLFAIVIIPSFFIFAYLLVPSPAEMDWSGLINALSFSFMVAGVVTLADIVLGVPMGLYIARHRDKKLAQIIDSLVNIPLIVPTTALGFSLALFWTSQDLVTNITFLVIMAHIAFTYPLVVRNVAGAVMEVDPSYEEAARTLGAKPFATFRTVLLPIVRSAVLAGAILAFTRSLGETGATVAVSSEANTVPVYIVNLMNSGDYYLAAVSAMVLIMVSFVFMFALRYTIRRDGGGY